MSKIIPFSYGDNLIRVVNDEETGEPLWVAKDVCTVLGYKNSRDAVSKLDDDERGVSEIATPSGKQTMQVINESGLYTLILRSNKPEAKPFKRWVTHEVLPSIRKTGSYGESNRSEDMKLIIEMLKAVLENQNKMMQLMISQVQEQKEKHLTPTQLDKIKLAVNRAAKPLADLHNFTWGRAVKEVYTELNGRMGVFAYYHIAPADFDEAMALLERMREVKVEEANTGEVVKLGLYFSRVTTKELL